MDLDSPREAVLWVLHSMRWQWLVGQMYAENKDRYGYYYNHRLATHGVMAAEEESELGWLLLVFWPKCYWILSSDTQRWVDRLSELPKFSMKDENKKWIISVRLISALLPFIPVFSLTAAKRAHSHAHRHAQSNFCLRSCVRSDAFCLVSHILIKCWIVDENPIGNWMLFKWGTLFSHHLWGWASFMHPTF